MSSTFIDKTNHQLILALQEDGRASNAEIARYLDINPATVAKRINQLLEDDVITIRAVPNPYKFGYIANAFITLNAELGKINSICEKLCENFNVQMVLTAFGWADILLFAGFGSWPALHKFVSEELTLIPGVTKVNVFFVKETVKRYRLFKNEERTMPDRPVELNDFDKRLILELSRDGRASYDQLASILDTSIPTVHRRTGALVRDNIIRIRAVANPARLGFNANSMILLKTDPHKTDEICETLLQYPEIYLVMKLVNSYDILIGVHASNFDQLYDIISEKLAHMEGLQKLDTFIRAQVKKRYFGFYLEDSIIDSEAVSKNRRRSSKKKVQDEVA